MKQTLRLTPEDSGLTITAYEDEEPVLIGGVALAGLQWSAAGKPFPAGVRVASVAHLPLRSWDWMLADGRLLWRARYPDVPEFGRQQQPQGWAEVSRFTNRPSPPGSGVPSSFQSPTRNHSVMGTYSQTLGGNGDRFANRRTFCADGSGGCDMGPTSVTPEPSGWTDKRWANPETVRETHTALSFCPRESLTCKASA